MKIITSISVMRRTAQCFRRQGKTLGFVPTMGALHKGHLSLVKRARTENDVVIVSIFVNPSQFGPGEDYLKYPRPFAADKAACEENGVDILFVPPPEQMYPQGYLTYVNVEKISERLCGAFRPGHFRGVATVVAKFFNIVQPDAAYFGTKDYQQLKIIQRMARDLDFPVRVVACQTVREASGLALSSRNRYLSDVEKTRSAAIYGALLEAKKNIHKGAGAALVAGLVRRGVRKAIAGAKFDYVELADASTLEPVKRITAPVVIAIAVRVGSTRLIDNMVVKP